MGVLFVVAPVAAAQVRADDLAAVAAPSVDALVERALARAPSLAARRARVEAARTALRAAGALPDPMIEIEYQDFNFPEWTIGSDPNSMLGGAYRQPLSSRGRRRAQRAVAEATVSQRQSEQVATATDLAAQVRLLYARLFVIDAERSTLVEADELTRLLEVTATARYAAGQGDQASVLRIQLERTRLGERKDDLDAERVALVLALNRLTDDPPDTRIGRVVELPAAPAPTVPSIAEAAGDRAPDVAVRRGEVDVATRQVEASRAELRPTWSVEAGYYWQGGADRMVNFMVGVELPLWKKRKQEPLVAAAEGERRAAELELASAAAEVRAEASRLLVESETASRQIVRYRDAILPQSSAALDATRSSYLGGRGEFASMLDEFRRWIEVRVQLARRESDRYSALVRLDALLSPVEGPGATAQSPATDPGRADLGAGGGRGRGTVRR